MSIISLQAVTTLLGNPSHPQRRAFLSQMDVMRSYEHSFSFSTTRLAGPNAIAVQAEDAERLLTEIRSVLGSRGYIPGKMFRPWELDTELYAGLDPQDSWMGWEFETGWVNDTARSEVAVHAFDNWDNVCFDHEGEGHHPVEITFAPANASAFDDGTAPALQFMEYVNANQNKVENTGHSYVGTHLNFSTPAIRSSPAARYPNLGLCARIAAVLNNSIHKLPAATTAPAVDYRKKFFGRSNIYGGCWHRAGGGTSWIECKLFRTAYTTEQFQNYLRTAKGLIAIAKFIEDTEGLTRGHYVSNLIQVIEDGATPILEMGTRDMSGSPENQYVSGRSIVDDDYYDDDDEDDYEEGGCDDPDCSCGGNW